jgi:bifunctional non-homologous end joining protein LigD
VELSRVDVEVGGRTVRLSNLDKPLWVSPLFRKRDLLAYYQAVAPVLLPHLQGRAITLGRFPDGVEAPGWYQTNCPPGRPDWMTVVEVQGKGGQRLRYCRIDELAALVWAANTGAIELHPFLACAALPDAPRALVLDLDPGAPAGLRECCAVALAARERLDALGLRSIAKTSGAKGLHVYVPLDGTQTFAETKVFVRDLAADLRRAFPGRVVDRMALRERAGKVFVDWGQNDANKSTVAPYSLRAAPVPSVSTPLLWEEVERGDADALRFGPTEVVERLARFGDLFAPATNGGQRLPLVGACFNRTLPG